MSDISGLYLIVLAGVAGYVLIARVPSILHTPMMSGSNFIHGIVLIGAMLALSGAQGFLELLIGFVAVTAAAANVVGGFVVTDRMLALFDKNASGERQGDLPPSFTSEQYVVDEDRRLPDVRKAQSRLAASKRDTSSKKAEGKSS